MTEHKCPIHNRPLVVTKKGSHERHCPICKNPFFEQIWNTVHKNNQNCLIITEGPPGTGKSYLDLKIAQELDPTFNENTLHERVIFNPRQFVNIIAEGKLKKGNAIVIEEGGVQADHRKWFTFNNMVINYILQTFRYQNLIALFNVPVIDYIDSDARKLFKYHIETVKIDFREGYNVYKVKQQSYNSATKKIYRKFLRMKYRGKWLKFNMWRTKKPNAKILHKYETIAQDFKRKLAADLNEQMQIIDKETKTKMTKQLLDIEKAAKKIIENKDRYLKSWGERTVINISLIEQDYKIGRTFAKRIKDLAEIELKKQGLIKHG